VNYALKDIVEASIAMAQDKMCDIHDATHAAIFWCFECEQGMCEEAHIMHSKAKASKSHQTNRIGAQEPLVIPTTFLFYNQAFFLWFGIYLHI
jgi:hypothetical protein